jgi:cell division protein FtsI/penicillin-binding protein 2
LCDHSGSAVVINYITGELLALASKTGFDPSIFSLGITTQQYALLQKLESPFFNRDLTGLYPPGSVFKPFTALIALHEHSFYPEYSWDTPLKWHRDHALALIIPAFGSSIST